MSGTCSAIAPAFQGVSHDLSRESLEGSDANGTRTQGGFWKILAGDITTMQLCLSPTDQYSHYGMIHRRRARCLDQIMRYASRCVFFAVFVHSLLPVVRTREILEINRTYVVSD